MPPRHVLSHLETEGKSTTSEVFLSNHKVSEASLQSGYNFCALHGEREPVVTY